MDKIIVPASITFESSFIKRKYSWKSDKNKETIYNILSKRAFIRFSCAKFSKSLSRLSQEERKINVNFTTNDVAEIVRNKKGTITLQGYGGKHPYIQVIVNNALPSSLRNQYDLIEKGKTSKTFPLQVILGMGEWKGLFSPEDFLIAVERDTRSLLRAAFKKGFTMPIACKGRSHDLRLIRQDGKEMILAISSHTSRSENRSKEKRIQKILMDISKMLPDTWNNTKVSPVIVSQTLDTPNSWSHTTTNYLEFYKQKLGFKFLTTDFKKGWEDNIVKELLKI